VGAPGKAYDLGLGNWKWRDLQISAISDVGFPLLTTYDFDELIVKSGYPSKAPE
jgi:hypothetical protein